MILKKRLYIFVLTCICSCFAFAQDLDKETDSVLTYVKHAMLFNKSMPQEKVYLHFDNTGYFKGERIWFKAYLRRADTGAPSNISKVLYVELLNPSGDVIQKRKLKVENGEAQGDILLDSILGTGFYEVRAFTRYMMNFGDATAFSRVFPIFKEPEQEGDYSKPTIDELSFRHRLPERDRDEDENALEAEDGKRRKAKGFNVSFYPEGGDLVRGLQSRVAFVVTDKDGTPVPTRGVIKNETEEALAVVRSGDDGRGIFEIIPQGEKLTLILTDEEKKLHTFSLPAPKAEGCVVRVNAVDEGDVKILMMSTPAMHGRLLGYTIMNGGRIVRADTLKSESAVQLEIDRNLLRPGVNQFTLFSTNGQIQAERLFFICPRVNDVDSIRFTTQTETLSPCGKVKFDVQTAPNADFSFSAMDAGTLTNGKQGSIHTWMLLGSELGGYVANPDYYFEADDKEHRLAADTLMLVQGWRRYDWNLIAGTHPFENIQQIEDHLYIFGQLRPSLSAWIKKNPVNGVDLTAYLYNKDGAHLSGECRTDSAGNYAFVLPDIEEEWKLSIQTRLEDKLKSYIVAINRHFSPKSRYLSSLETSMIPKNKANFFKPKNVDATNEFGDDEDGALRRRVGKREFVTQTVKVKAKKHYWTDFDGGWYNENNGRRKALLFYDCDAASDEIADKGEVQPTVYQWLSSRNKFLERTDLTFSQDMNSETPDPSIKFIAAETSDSSGNFFIDGPTYNGRPIVWILNNKYAGTTSLGATRIHSFHVVESNIEPMPTFLDEVKSVYIVEQANVMNSYIICSDIEGNSPAIFFVYTHPTYSTASKKGHRNTHFQGFNVPSKFEMEDYSVIPPMDDFRRTIYWQPSVKTDAQGKATIEFYNNSTCEQMYISAEGMSKNGRCLVNE